MNFLVVNNVIPTTLYHTQIIINRSLYINDILIPKISTRTLRSTDDRYELCSHRCRLSRTLNATFVYSAQYNWNKLPLSILLKYKISVD